MKTTDFNSNLSSSKLKENINKMFNMNVDLQKYSREQLEDMRNKLRTSVFQLEGQTGINDLLTNETYQKNKAMLDLLNTKIKEMLGEDIKNLKSMLLDLQEGKKGVKDPKRKIKTKGTTSGVQEPTEKTEKKDSKSMKNKTSSKDITEWKGLDVHPDRKTGISRDQSNFDKKELAPGRNVYTRKRDPDGTSIGVDDRPAPRLSGSERMAPVKLSKHTGRVTRHSVDGRTSHSEVDEWKGLDVHPDRKTGVSRDQSNFDKKELAPGRNVYTRKRDPDGTSIGVDDRPAPRLSGSERMAPVKLSKHTGRVTRHSVDGRTSHSEIDESKPSAGMSKKEKSEVVKKAKAGKDLGKPGKGFEKVEKAAKKSGAKDPKAVAGAAMWKQQAKESFKRNVNVVNESIAYLLNENEEEKAKAITAAGDIVNDYTSWMQRVGQYQAKSMIELVDTIRGEFGPNEAETFKQAVGPALATTLETLMQQREAISNAVAVLAGEQISSGQPMGAEPTPPVEPGLETSEPDQLNAPTGDEFGGSDAAAGAGTTGREIRENKFLKKLSESHNIISILSK